MTDYILEMKGITKEFPGVKALDDVGFKVRQGEIHCLVGENGAGKSTLMKVLSGVYPFGTYRGEIVINGEIQQFRHISDSERQGIAIIYQELALFPELSIYENIFMGHEIMNGIVIDWNETILQASKVLERVGLELDPATKIKDLGVGQRQLVEIAKALSKDVHLLILDEPTAALNEDDSENLLNLLRELKEQGVTSIMISHKLKEVVSIADTITVLRDGKVVCSLDAQERQISEQEIIRHMVGREIENIYPKREGIEPGEVIFELKNWSVTDRTSRREILHSVNLQVRRGEIVALAGLMGAGRTELALSLFGNVSGYEITSGEMYLNGKQVQFKHPSEAIAQGMAYVTEDRKANGLILIQDVKFNVSLPALSKLARGLVVNEHEEIIMANEYRESLDIRTPSVQTMVGTLSGGNQQKTSLAKWLFAEPSLLILDEPTRGIDVGAKFEIYTLMNQLVEQGMSIIMISSELLEVLGMSDRLYIMSEGTITGELAVEDATEEKVMAMATKTGEGVAG
ncbi:MAG: ATP-binding cassette domain-containing protein [Firmicutes bacterium]|nr:ATP-binding cassette domain-containing protein [Bacillota bacterium]